MLCRDLLCVERTKNWSRLVATLQRHVDTPFGSSGPMLEVAEALLLDQKSDEGAIVAWLCLNSFPDSSDLAKSLLARADTLIPGILFSSNAIAVHTRALTRGGSWLKEPEDFQWVPTAWDSSTIAAFSAHLRRRRARCFLDVGANSGSFALLSSVHPGLRCHAIEPNPNAVDLLTRHIAANGLASMVTPHRCALSDQTGLSVLRIPTQTGLATLGDAGQFDDHEEVVVETMTLDDFVTSQGIERLDAIKLDTEGHELPILVGGERTIRAMRPILLLDAADVMMARHGYTLSELESFLRDLRYRITPVGAEDLLAIPQSLAHR